jgi:hypothetical protein
MSRLSKGAVASALLAALSAAPFVSAQEDLEAHIRNDDRPPDSQVELRNDSRWSIQELYFAPVGSDRWGPNQLSHDAVRPGDSFTLTGIRCDKYDVKLIDEDGDKCVVRSVSLCAADKIWHIDDRDLLSCQSHVPQGR